MYQHFAMYSESLGSVTNSDVNAATDDVIQTRNSHLIMSEPFNVIGAYAASSTLLRARFGNVALGTRGVPHVYPTGRGDTIPARPEVADWRDSPLVLPMNEEITLEASTDAAGPVIANIGLWLAKPEWNRNLPVGEKVGWVRATAVVAAGAASAWTALANITMERDLFNGVYAIIGAYMIAANAISFRLRLPSQPTVQGRQLRPGGLVQNTVGLMPWEAQGVGLGEWGRFHTFELPSVQTFDDTAGGTYELRMNVLYLGRDQSLLMAG